MELRTWRIALCRMRHRKGNRSRRHNIWCETANGIRPNPATRKQPCGLIVDMTSETNRATPAETRADIMRLSARGYTHLRQVLVQLPDTEDPRASTLARMLSERKHRPLLLYIMLLTCWPWLEDRREPLPGGFWVRALTAPGAPTWSPSTLSRSWGELEELGLITKPEKREGRLMRPTPRREDGAVVEGGGVPYDAPGGRRDRWNTYFALPDEFWTEGIFAKLSLPALVMLLLVAKETQSKPEVWLTYDRIEDWYGIKQKSAQNGLTELRKAGLLHRRIEEVKTTFSATGSTVHMWYSLTGPFGREARLALQDRAAKERKKRLKRAARAKNTPPKE